MYNLISSSLYGVYQQTEMENFSVSESTTSTQTPNLSCSFSGSTSITYSLSSYNSVAIPSFVSINSVTGILSIIAPSVSSSTTYSFYIDSTAAGISGPIQKIINLIVTKCTASNWQICTINDSTVWATCSPGFNLSLGSWNLQVIQPAQQNAQPAQQNTQPAQQNTQPAQQNTQPTQQDTKISEVAKLLSTINQVAIGAIILISVGSNFSNLSSMASLWSVINQMQLFK